MKAAYISKEVISMSKNAKISLGIACFSLIVFLISTLGLKRIRFSDWIFLILAVINFGMFIYYRKKNQ